MRRLRLVAVVFVLIVLAAPVYAAGFGISPTSVDVEVPTEGSVQQAFKVYGLDSASLLRIDLEDIPLRVEPMEAVVGEDEAVTLTFYGDGTGKTYKGKVRFIADTGSSVLAGIKVKAIITQTETTSVWLRLATYTGLAAVILLSMYIGWRFINSNENS